QPEVLAKIAFGRLKTTEAQRAEALRGEFTEHHRFTLRLHLELIDAHDKAIRDVDQSLDVALAPFTDAKALLTTMDGWGDTVAEVFIGEAGIDMNRFPTAGHLRSWAGACPSL